MDIQVKDVNDFTKELTISLTTDEKKVYDEQALKKVKKKAELPGFRKGHLPLPLVKAHFAYEIENEAISIAMDDIYPKAIDELNLPVVAPGKLKDVKPDGDVLLFTFEVEVEPTVELKKVKGLELKKIVATVTDEHVEQAVNDLKDKYAVVQEIEEGAETGDTVELDMQELDENNVPLVGKKYDNLALELGKNTFDEELEKQLIGAKAGEQKIISKVYPDDYEDESWRGKKEIFQAVIKKVTRKELPETNDEFAQTVSDQFNTMDDLLNDVRTRLQAEFEKQGKDQLYHEIVHQMIEQNPFEVPPAMVENYLDHMVQDIKRQYQGANIDDNILRQYYKGAAETNVKWYLIKKKIIEDEKIEVTDEEVEKKLDELPGIDENTKAQIKQYPGYLNSLKEDLLEEKVFQFIIDNATVTEVTPEELEKEKQQAEEPKKKTAKKADGAKKSSATKKSTKKKSETDKKKKEQE
ncbi:MAG: trigger factor [Calditrichia bacterium]